jgi:integrase
VGSITLAQAAERYLAAKGRKRTIAEDRRQLEHLKAAFGADTLLSQITAAKVSAYKAQHLGTKSERTDRPLTAAAVNRPLALLRHLLRLAHEEWEILVAVPKIRLEKEPQGRIRWLEPDEESRLLAACGKSQNRSLLAVVTVALETGLRKGELLGLTWDRVDFSRGVLRLELTKSGKRREVPMRQVVYTVLSSLHGPREGRVWSVGSMRTAFENAVREAKLDRGFHFHDTRHHFASWYVMRGGALPSLQQILGHATLAMTMRYSHLSPKHLREEMAKTEARPDCENDSDRAHEGMAVA